MRLTKKGKPYSPTWTGEPVPIRIRNQDYPSISAAARALGIHMSTVRGALEQGRLDTVGLGLNHARKHPITANGKEFDSRTAAARFHGIPPRVLTNAVWRARKEGNNSMIYRGIKWKWVNYDMEANRAANIDAATMRRVA